MRILAIFFISLSMNLLAVQAYPDAMPFPMAQKEKTYRIAKPKYSQKTLNKDVRQYYEKWLVHYYRTYPVPYNNVGYIEGHVTGGYPEPWSDNQDTLGPMVSASEHTGYGMIIFAIMGEKEKYDSLVRLYLAHKHKENHMMNWVITQNHIAGTPEKDEIGSATDGDMDIAYGLLMGAKQWPGKSPFTKSYMDMAKDMINGGIYSNLIHHESKRIQLGDWHDDFAPYTKWVTRSSDFMLDNLRAFAIYADTDKKPLFNDAIDEIYYVLNVFNSEHNNGTGLASDFIVGKKPRPAPEKFLDEDFPTNHYSENACRLPFRLATDYLHSGDERSKAQLEKIASWIAPMVKGKWENVVDSYTLDGKDTIDWDQAESPYHDHQGKRNNLEALHFSSGLISSQIVREDGKKDLSKGWKFLRQAHAYGTESRFLAHEGKTLPLQDAYFKDTLALLNMMVISGNWWFPG